MKRCEPLSSSICLAVDPRKPSGPAAESAANDKAGYTTASAGFPVSHRTNTLAARGRSIHIILFEQQGADEADDGLVIGEDADDVGPALDLAVDALDRIDRVQLGAMLPGEGHVGEHVMLGLVHDGGELGDLGPDLVGDRAPLGAGGLGRFLGEGGGDEGGDDAAAALAGMRQHVPA